MKLTLLFILVVILGLLCRKANAGIDLGYSPSAQIATQEFIEAIKSKNREQMNVVYERIQQILRDMPDASSNSELIDEYLALVAKLRQMAEESKEMLVNESDLDELINLSGRHGAVFMAQMTTTREDKQ